MDHRKPRRARETVIACVALVLGGTLGGCWAGNVYAHHAGNVGELAAAIQGSVRLFVGGVAGFALGVLAFLVFVLVRR